MKTIVYPNKNKVYIVPNKVADAVTEIWRLLNTVKREDLSQEEFSRLRNLKEEQDKVLESFKSYPIGKILDGDYL